MRFAGIAAAALVGTTMAAPLPSEKVNHLEKRLNIGKLFSGINWPDVVTRFTSKSLDGHVSLSRIRMDG